LPEEHPDYVIVSLAEERQSERKRMHGKGASGLGLTKIRRTGSRGTGIEAERNKGRRILIITRSPEDHRLSEKG